MKIEYVGSNGSEILDVQEEKALEKIRELLGSDKVLYIDGFIMNPEKINPEMLKEANSIAITDEIIGG